MKKYGREFGYANDHIETNDIIQKLSVSSQEINKIVAVISPIAEQTNMLALNATIKRTCQQSN